MGDSSREHGALTPEQVGARVTAILAAAERDAREIIAAARREALAGPLPPREAQPFEPAGFAEAPALTALTRTLDALSSRVSAVERAIDARLEALWRALGLQPADAGVGEVPEVPAEPAESAERGAGRAERGAGRAERLRAVDLALRGFSRAQIAAELRSTVPETQIEQLLDDVLEHA
jgi:hypothetical protein